MTPDQIKALVEREYPHLIAERRSNPDGWAFYLNTVQQGSNPTRIARAVQRRPSSPVTFKPAISARLANNKRFEIPITGGASQIRELFDTELALWREHFGNASIEPLRDERPKGRDRSTRSAAPLTSHAAPGAQDFVYEFSQGAVDPTRPLIYLWEVENRAGDVVFRYVGKATKGAGRPIQQYRRNIRNLLWGRPYRKGKPDAYRAVHRRLAEAVSAGETVRLKFICNVEEHENIDELERRFQRQYHAQS